MDKMQKISIVWGIVAVGIFALLTIFGFLYKNKTSIYKELENKIVEAEKKYVDAKFLYPDTNKSVKTTSQELISSGFLEELKANDEVCEGYAVVTKDGVAFNYKGYIKCNDYQTKGYNE